MWIIKLNYFLSASPNPEGRRETVLINIYFPTASSTQRIYFIYYYYQVLIKRLLFVQPAPSLRDGRKGKREKEMPN